MKLFEKIKNALFEEEEEEQEEIAKKIDVDATINQEEKVKIRHYDEPEINDIKPVKETSPIIFDMDDFEEVEKEEVPKQEFTVPVYNEPVKEQKIIYGGYEKDVMKNERTKFKPSPIISPVYGILDHVEVTNDGFPHKVNPNIDIITDTKKTVSLDEVREKAFGNTREIKKLEEEDFNVKEEKEEKEESKDLLYEMEKDDDTPGIEKISLGDAEEYFEDLGLEYDVDYKDLAKEKMTRCKKNKNLTEEVEEEIKENKKIEQETSKAHKKAEEKVMDEEKNLYDLIDLMYDEKN